jgi:hypothetical protein
LLNVRLLYSSFLHTLHCKGVTGIRPSRAGAAAVGLKTLRTNSAKCEKVRQMDAIRVRALRMSYCEEQSTATRTFSQPYNAEYPSRVVYDENKDSSTSSEIKVEYKHDVRLGATEYDRAVKDYDFQSSDILPGTLSLLNCNTVYSGGSKELAGSKRPVPFSVSSKPIGPISDSWCATAKSSASTQSVASSSSQGATAEARMSALEGHGTYTMKPNPHVKSVKTESPKIETETHIKTGARISNYLETHNRQRDDGESSVLSFKRVRHAGNFYIED